MNHFFQQNFTRSAKLKRFYKILTTNTDGTKEFISTMEGEDRLLLVAGWHYIRMLERLWNANV